MSIRFDNLSFTYTADRKATIRNLTAEFDSKQITVLTGPSGCGKSTLLYLAAGIYPHNAGSIQSGRVTVAGTDPAVLPPYQRCRLVGVMFQNPELQFCMDTVRNELIFCLENCSTPPDTLEEHLHRALAFCEIEHLKDRTLVSLSGGERQKVMLACLTALNPQWLLLDEPFANIDDTSARAIAKKLLQLHRERGTGILAVDHRLETWIGIADTIRIMEGHQLLPQAWNPQQLDPDTLARYSVIAPGCSYQPSLPDCTPGTEVLRLDRLSVSHGETRILKEITFDFQRGVIYAILGQSGCGKSTLFGALSGLYRYTGTATLEGYALNRLPRNMRGSIGFVTQCPQDQFVADTVRQELLLSLRRASDAQVVCEQILRAIELWAYRDVSPYILSQGQQRRLGTAAWMAYDCRVLVCDEPTYAQDRKNTLAIMDRLCRLARERQTALIFSTHDRQLARDYADVILELKEGTLYAADQSCN